MMRFVRSAFVIARRDFAATVLSKAFIFFLLGPLFPLLFGGVFAGIGTNVASQATVSSAASMSSSCEPMWTWSPSASCARSIASTRSCGGRPNLEP